MNEQEANDRIKQMISFVQEEAKEKAREIDTKTEDEYNRVKSTHLNNARKKLMADNTKRWKQLEVKRRIDRSSAINSARMEIMKARNDCMNHLMDEARKELAHRSKKNPTQYKKVLEDLVVNGLIKLLEKHVVVQCRASDKHLVEGVLDSAKHRYLHIMKESTGKDYEVSLDVDHHHLPPGPDESSHGQSCSGGVILHSHHGKIRCINTLDERLSAVIAAKTPELRKLLFS